VQIFAFRKLVRNVTDWRKT